MKKIVTGLGDLFYRIPVSFTRKGVARSNSFYSHNKTFFYTVFLDSFFHISRTRWGITTLWGEMGEGVLIDCNEAGEEFFHIWINYTLFT